MVRSATYCAPIGVINLTKEIHLDFIVKDERFWNSIVTVETETMGVNLD